VGAERIAPAHGADVAVPVKVVGIILVHEPVPIVVERVAEAPVVAVAAGVGEEVVPAIGIHHRHHVETARVHETGDFRVLAVAGEELVQEIEAHLAALDLVAMDVAVRVDRRLLQLRAGSRVVHGEAPDGPPLVAVSGHVEPGQLGMGLMERLERPAHFLVGVVVVERQGHGRPRPVRPDGKSQHQGNHQAEAG